MVFKNRTEKFRSEKFRKEIYLSAEDNKKFEEIKASKKLGSSTAVVLDLMKNDKAKTP